VQKSSRIISDNFPRLDHRCAKLSPQEAPNYSKQHAFMYLIGAVAINPALVRPHFPRAFRVPDLTTTWIPRKGHPWNFAVPPTSHRDTACNTLETLAFRWIGLCFQLLRILLARSRFHGRQFQFVVALAIELGNEAVNLSQRNDQDTLNELFQISFLFSNHQQTPTKNNENENPQHPRDSRSSKIRRRALKRSCMITG